SSQYGSLHEGFISVQNMLLRNQFPPIAFLFELDVCKKIGMFDETLPVLGDWDFHSRFMLQHDIWVHPEFLAFYHHRISATGSMGNTVHAGAHLHRAYNQILRNKWIRSDLNGTNGNTRTAILLALEIQESLKSELPNFNNSTYRPKHKNAFRQAISDGLRAFKKTLKGYKND
ncbi:hypothetical protein, partial [Bacillus anthracis]|uniref:hypothetical protein n=1 Tax=Bacillus anthracis TaxID=1392 RepID=UPI0039A72AFB